MDARNQDKVGSWEANTAMCISAWVLKCTVIRESILDTSSDHLEGSGQHYPPSCQDGFPVITRILCMRRLLCAMGPKPLSPCNFRGSESGPMQIICFWILLSFNCSQDCPACGHKGYYTHPWTVRVLLAPDPWMTPLAAPLLSQHSMATLHAFLKPIHSSVLWAPENSWSNCWNALKGLCRVH